MKLGDAVGIVKFYVRLFGISGLILLVDRAANKILPTKQYVRARSFLRRIYVESRKPSSTRPVINIVTKVKQGDRAWFLERFPGTLETVVFAADNILRHEFDILGTGLRSWGEEINWLQDVNLGYSWPEVLCGGQDYSQPSENGADIKIPWELSRFQHLVVLGQAWQLTRDEKYADELIVQWEHWLKVNPFYHGINWTNAMEAGIRAVNLLFATSLITDSPNWTQNHNDLLNRSLREHGQYIESNLEVFFRDGRNVSGNHLLANLCALGIIGISLPDSRESGRWRRAGYKGLESEMKRQVLGDGFFFESSSAYHRLAAELFLIPWLVARTAASEMTSEYTSRLQQMIEAVMYLTRPDGCVPQIGDNDDGRLVILADYPEWPRHDYRYLLALGAVSFGRTDFKSAAGRCPVDVYWLLGRKGVEEFDCMDAEAIELESRGFHSAGLHVIHGVEGDYALIRTGVPLDRAPVAHAHNDALAIELWVGGQPVFVDRGSACYTSDLAQRNMWRSTSSHNTVVIDGGEQNEIPHKEIFSLGRDLRARLISWHVACGLITVEAEVVKGQESSLVRHARLVKYDARIRQWLIEDRLEAVGGHSSDWNWHLSPGYQAVIDGHTITIGKALIVQDAGTAPGVDSKPALQAVGYGKTSQATTLSERIQWSDAIKLTKTVGPTSLPAKQGANVGR